MSSNVDRAVPLGSSSEADARPSDIIADLIAARLGCDVRALSDDAEPLKLGLDSLGMMSVINQARRLGVSATFEQLAERPTSAPGGSCSMPRAPSPRLWTRHHR